MAQLSKFSRRYAAENLGNNKSTGGTPQDLVDGQKRRNAAGGRYSEAFLAPPSKNTRRYAAVFLVNGKRARPVEHRIEKLY